MSATCTRGRSEALPSSSVPLLGPFALHPAGGANGGDALVDLRVVVAGRDPDLGALGPGENTHDDPGGRDGRQPGGDLRRHVSLLALEHPDVALGRAAVDGLLETLHGLLLLH